MDLLFNTLSRLVIAFLPRSKCLLISWLQSPSAVILEPPQNKSVTGSTFFPIYTYTHILIIYISSVQLLSHILLFATPWTAAHQASLPITNSQSLLKLMSIELVMPSNHLILLPPSSFPASGSFAMSQLFTSDGQTIGVSASASVLPMNIQD